MITGATRLLKYLRHEKAKRKPRRKLAEYRRRDRVLPELGYSSYREYLASGDWRQIRSGILAEMPDCVLCRRPACQVHHLSYAPRVLLGLERAERDDRLREAARQAAAPKRKPKRPKG
jgi:hypothetical protein